MNILQLISSGGYFGAENVLVQLAEALQRDQECCVITGVINNLSTPHIEVTEESQKRDIESEIFPCKGKFDINTVIKLRKYIRDKRVNIIHSHGYKSNLFAYFSCMGLPIAHVATCHNWLGDNMKMKFYANLDRFLLQKFDKIVAVSPEVEKKILDSGVSTDRVSIIKNGITINRFQNSSGKIREEFGIPSSHIVIGTVGRISEEKGHRFLCQAAMNILKDYSNITFLIVGDGNAREPLQTEFPSSSLIFTGFRSDLPELYTAMDVFVLPSLTEGLPMVLLEAMVSGLPVVATKVGAITEVVIDSKTGLLIAPQDEKEIQTALLQLLRAPDKCKTMGNNGKKRVMDNYSAELMAQQYKSLYCEITKGCNS